MTNTPIINKMSERLLSVASLVTPGRARFFGLFGREDDYVLPWTAIVRIGTDIILVDIQDKCSRRKRPRRGLF